MEIRQRSFNFPSTSHTGPQSAEETISFPRRVLRAAAGIAGYSATFENRDDHHLGRMTVELSTRINPADDTQVIVAGTFGLRDWSGEWDDSYSGNIQYVLLADLERASPPPPGQPRGDLIVVDAEITQVIQHFRSAEHLDSANVFPDNSIRLIANKPTAVRLYVDYDAGSGLAVIDRLTGTLDIVRGAATDTLTPLETIVPRRDVETERGQQQHTLNFVIPEDMCVGDITIRARVASAADSTQFSRTFERTLSFDNIPALPVIAVGINYTGPDVNDGAPPSSLTAPTMADFVNTLMLTEKLFPIPQVQITSFMTMDYDKEVESDINEGCDKMDDLLDAVRDFRGDSEDLVLGLFNTGLNTGSVGGCGGDGAAVGRVNGGGTAAHELAHALGRQHAPCDNVTRCATPRNTDGNYPHYSGYDSDSIGEFGFDTASGQVRDPSVAHDIMGYSGNKWISPYTYKGLMTRIPEQFGGAGASAAFIQGVDQRVLQDRGDWIKIKQPQLFMNIVIERDRSVTVKPAFHFPAYPQARGNMKTDFTAELVDDKGKVLKRACLYAAPHGATCGCDQGLWPLKIRQAISFAPKAARLVIYDCDKKVYEQHITQAPDVRLEVTGADQRDQPDLVLKWDARCQGADDRALWFLVQWRDVKGTWRGAAPRMQARTLCVPKTLFRDQRSVALRVLASSGIATGQAMWQGRLELPPRAPGEVQIGLVGVPSGATGELTSPVFLRAAVTGAYGVEIANAQVRWYDRRGVEVGRGRTLDLRNLGPGFHCVTAVALDSGSGPGTASWVVERRRDGQFILHFKKPASA